MIAVEHRLIADALHNAEPDCILVPRCNNRKLTKAEAEDMRMRIQYGKGVVVGVVSALMSTGRSFDDAWSLCLEIKPEIYPACVPEGWPSAADYLAAAQGT